LGPSIVTRSSGTFIGVYIKPINIFYLLKLLKVRKFF
jgi:hypothetical protein